VSSLTGMAEAVSFKTRETVLCDTPASFATSCIVGMPDSLRDLLRAINVLSSETADY
jgi:hypothetical protein